MNTPSQIWKQVKPGSIVSLSDAQTIVGRVKAGKGPTPATYQVKSVLTIRQKDGLAEWRLAELEAGLWLMAKIVDAAVDLVVLRDAPDWVPSTRKELVERELLFMFNAPANPDNFEYDELTYVDSIPVTNAEINGNQETVFYLKPQREQHGTAEWQPPQSGIGDVIATIAEFSTEVNKGFVDTQLVIVELGAKPSDGLVRFLVGRSISLNDANVTK
jgi:hypothetical protein